MKVKKKFSKRMLALLLSAVLAAEPAFGTTVYAVEPNADQRLSEGAEGNEGLEDVKDNPGTPGNPEDKEDSDISGDQEGGDATIENPDKGNQDPNDQDIPGESGSDQDEKDDENANEETPDGQETEDEDGNEEQDQETEGGEEVSVSDNTLEDEDLEADSDKFSKMPSGYSLSSEQKEMKSALSASMGQFDESQEGETFVEREVFAFADSREEAEDIANAYCAELIEYDEGVAVLKLKKGTSVGDALMIASDMDNNFPAVYPDYYRYAYEEEIPQDNSSLTVVEEEYELEDGASNVPLSGEPTLEAYAEAVQAMGDPNMSYDSQYYQWQHVNVGSVYAWGAGYKGQGVKVAVLDTGVTPNGNDSVNCTVHEDKTEEKNSTDGQGHGTHVAGIIAAQLNNKGGAGIAPEAEIVDIKVLNSEGSGKDSNIIQGINSAISKKVDIINMSLGGIGYNPAVEVVVNKAYEENGIAVFVAAGNDGGTNMTYPAALNNVICVAAVDNNNQRASFSNYGPWVELSAPGVDIWSIAIAGDSAAVGGFRKMSGTSQATPVAAGEAAVILSGKDKLQEFNGKSGKDKVDALKKVMQANIISAGSGMGKGVTSLTKVFKLSVATAKPGVPTISAVDTSNNAAQSMDITIEAQMGMKICYTTNGKNPSFKNGEVDANTTLVETNTVTFPVDGKNAAKGTVKAMAVNASGVASSVKSFTYQLKPYVKTIVISGPTRVEKKKAIQLTAVIAPSYATKKDVKWTLLTEGGQPVDAAQIKIEKGKITTTDKAVAGKYKVTATAQDNPDADKVAKSQEYTIEVVETDTAIQKIVFSNQVKKELWMKKTPSDATISLFEYVTAQDKGAGGKLKDITDRTELANRLQWTSSKPAVATVDNKGKVTAKTVGTTTITVKADDNLGKKATVNIAVKQAVTGITITTDKGEKADKNFTVALGKSMALKADISPAKPANNKINWSIAPDSSNSVTDAELKNITINKSNGKITVKAAAKAGKYVVTAEAADQQGAKATRPITVVGGAIGEITLSKAEQKVTLYTQNVSAEKTNTKTITATIKGVKDRQGNYGTFDPNAYMVTNSNESVVTVKKIENKAAGTVAITLESKGTMFGKANIVIASTDGSNKKATCAVTVSGGISKVEILDAQGAPKKNLTLFREGTAASAPSTTKLYAKITSSEGANAQAYSVTSNNPLVKVTDYNTSTGEISLKASAIATGKAVVTLMATDGSKKKATCTVTVVNPVSKINIAPKGGESGCVAKGKSLQLYATLESEYGVVSNKKVTWALSGGANIDINKSSGKITAKSNATGTGGLNYVDVTATACDGSNVQAKYKVYITDPVAYLFLGDDGTLLPPTYVYRLGLVTQTKDQDKNDKEQLGGSYVFDLAWFDKQLKSCGLSGGVSVTSSNPKVASATVQYPKSGPIVRVSADNLGTATITIKAMDGGGTQVKYKFKVVPPKSN